MIDPKRAPRVSDFEANDTSISLRKKSHPWAWIVGLIVVLLMIWGFFGMDHLKPDMEPATAPAAATVVVD